ncbi:hypothetical protein HJC23_006416 [Cyclotella cryptica]|uniref:J domain-containing protein n=1 Tax=Cyclotella cryptica TaxID=29204 RepID=A0ABD3QUF9_9STRA|eukprot:CCRYP_001822-RA/>CCRYP_001822-RA protein AED:0.00 eAED:0.00 QI:343/-1/1/1/-1/1/1/216/226
MTRAAALRHCYFSSTLGTCHPNRRLRCTRSFSSCPFQTLGLKNGNVHRHRSSPSPLKSPSVSYDEVRAAFRRLALLHHPDTAARDTSDASSETSYTRTASTEFARIREAFEAIVEGPGGVAVLRDNYNGTVAPQHSHESDNSDNAASHSHDQNTFFLHPSVNPQVLHEVVHVANTMNPGGLDRGGMWQYANMIRHMAEDQGKGLPPLRVAHGVDGDHKKTRRRRKR